jgi:hypothetical protein
MFRKLISIGFAINIILCSVGIRVMQHHCVWCGGDRIEIMSHEEVDSTAGSCCSKKETKHHDCQDEGCCQPKLLKLTNGMAGDEALEIKPVDFNLFDFQNMMISNCFLEFSFISATLDFCQKRGSPEVGRSPGFLSPLRC